VAKKQEENPMPAQPENKGRAPAENESASNTDTHPIGHATRDIRQAPFCYQHKAALRLIRESFDAEKAVASAIGVYVALTEIASDDEWEEFTTTHGHIAQKSGLSPRSVASRLSGLAQIGLVKISTPALKCPSTYTLLPVAQPLQSDKQPLQSVLQRRFFRPLQASEDKKKNREQGQNKARFVTGQLDQSKI
jgi:hypothetical protein